MIPLPFTNYVCLLSTDAITLLHSAQMHCSQIFSANISTFILNMIVNHCYFSIGSHDNNRVDNFKKCLRL